MNFFLSDSRRSSNIIPIIIVFMIVIILSQVNAYGLYGLMFPIQMKPNIYTYIYIYILLSEF